MRKRIRLKPLYFTSARQRRKTRDMRELRLKARLDSIGETKRVLDYVGDSSVVLEMDVEASPQFQSVAEELRSGCLASAESPRGSESGSTASCSSSQQTSVGTGIVQKLRVLDK